MACANVAFAAFASQNSEFTGKMVSEPHFAGVAIIFATLLKIRCQNAHFHGQNSDDGVRKSADHLLVRSEINDWAEYPDTLLNESILNSQLASFHEHKCSRFPVLGNFRQWEI